MENKGYKCSVCGKIHDGLPLDLVFNAPFYWNDELLKSDPEKNFLSSDMCVVNADDFFIRAIVEIPIIGTDKTFNWGIWVSLSKENFKRYSEVYGTEKELSEPHYFGWFSSQLKGYPDCLKIKTTVYLQGNKLRPKIVLDHSDPHLLCQEQHGGITMHRVEELIKLNNT
jgi:hypothetical protein